jgi:hypothetical protein
MRFLFCLLLVVLPELAIAQQAAPDGSGGVSPITDMIARAKNSLDNLQYTSARTAAREVLALPRLKRSQEIAALQVAAAAYFPDEESARMPDSATYYLQRLVRMMPVGSMPVDVSSAALDSQLVITRISTFGATARAPLQVTLRGIDRRPAIEVFSTKPARWQLYAVPGDGAVMLLDTLAATTNGRFSLAAHDGSRALIEAGKQELRILSLALDGKDTITVRLDASAVGAAPALLPLPGAPDTTRFLPERTEKALGAGIAGGIIVGGVTWALANSLKPPGALRDEASDSRGISIAIGISAGAVIAGIFDRGRPIPKNIKANAATRSTYLKQVGDVTDTNRRRIAEYSVVLSIDPEMR